MKTKEHFIRDDSLPIHLFHEKSRFIDAMMKQRIGTGSGGGGIGIDDDPNAQLGVTRCHWPPRFAC